MSQPTVQLYAMPANLYFLKGTRIDPPETGEVYLYIELNVQHHTQADNTPLRTAVAHHAHLNIKFPGYYLNCRKVYGYPYQVQKERLLLNLDDLFSGETKEIIIRFDLKKPSESTPIDENLAFDVTFEYDDATANMEKVVQKQKLLVQGTYNAELYKMGVRQRVIQEIAIVEPEAMSCYPYTTSGPLSNSA